MALKLPVPPHELHKVPYVTYRTHTMLRVKLYQTGGQLPAYTREKVIYSHVNCCKYRLGTEAVV